MLTAPFPWFGGKRRVADIVWRAFGPDVPNYVEPFAGSLAVLLGRPGGAGKVETVNDLDGGIVNFWRAVSADPDAVARWCDWPVSELDLHARHQWIVDRLPALREALRSDPAYHDAQIAGWWVWGICQWIGNGWCREVERTSRARPHLADAGMNVHSPGAIPLDLFHDLQTRLRRARIVCGEWDRVLGPSPTGATGDKGMSPCAVFLDPPYAHDVRAPQLYAQEDASVSASVRKWALANGDNPNLRIALCGYDNEHEMPPTWACVPWKARGGYCNTGDSETSNANRDRERIWLSPHCLPLNPRQRELFA